MSVLSVVQVQNGELVFKGSVLYERACEIDFETFPGDTLIRVVGDMFETLYSNPSGVGLAANQVGLLLRLCVVDIKRDGKAPIVLINPSYQGLGEMIESKEVCLSFPNNIVTTKRYSKIKVCYQNVKGEPIEEIVEGFKCTVFQHEIDHLNGICHVSSEYCNLVEDYQGRPKILANNVINKLWG